MRAGPPETPREKAGGPRFIGPIYRASSSSTARVPPTASLWIHVVSAVTTKVHRGPDPARGLRGGPSRSAAPRAMGLSRRVRG
jgi:hypothetical protein